MVKKIAMLSPFVLLAATACGSGSPPIDEDEAAANEEEATSNEDVGSAESALGELGRGGWGHGGWGRGPWGHGRWVQGRWIPIACVTDRDCAGVVPAPLGEKACVFDPISGLGHCF